MPPNDAPSLSPNINPQGGFDSTEFFMEEGENLCFDISFFDPDTPADSLSLNVNGQILILLLPTHLLQLVGTLTHCTVIL